MQLIALAIAPGLAICLFIFHRDAYNREPKFNLIVSFILGALTVVTAVVIEQSLKSFSNNSIAGTAIKAFFFVALTEEFGKFAVLRLYAYPRKSFDEPLDGIIYGVMISMGFATLENILYVVQSAPQGYGYQVAFLRMFTAVPAHATFGVLMGYHAGRAKFDAPNEKKLLFTGIVWAVLFHGAYDFCLFLQGKPSVNEYISDGLLFSGAIISFILAIRLSLKHIKMHRRLSQQTYHPTETMTIRKAYPHDIPLIRELTSKTWPQTYENLLTKEQIDYMLEMSYSEESLMKQMESGDEFVILYDGVLPIGFASIGLSSPGSFKLHKIYILPSYQGKGAGRFVLDELAKAIRKKGGALLYLNVKRDNDKAKLFYEKNGFKVVREEDIDIGNGFFLRDYVMEKQL